MEYSKEQLNIINSTAQKISIQAVAGSGKTTTIMGRLQKLYIDGKINKVLFISFSNAAKDAVNEKIKGTILPDEVYDSFTFAKFFMDIAKSRYNYKFSFNSLVYALTTETPVYNDMIENISETIDNTKKRKIYLEDVEMVLLELMKREPQNYEGMFSPLNQYDTIIVDEAADTAIKQLLVLKRMMDLSGKEFNVIIAGDENQMISDFRGVPNFSMQVMGSLLHATSYPLQTNYRSTDDIIFAGNAVLDTMESNKITKLRQKTPQGDDFTLLDNPVLSTSSSEFVRVHVNRIFADALNRGESVAVIVRSNKNIQKLVELMNISGIPISSRQLDKPSPPYFLTQLANKFHGNSMNEVNFEDMVRDVRTFNGPMWNKFIKEDFPNHTINRYELIDYIMKNERWQSQSKDEKSAMNKVMASLGIYTIHGSKGLEFDRVIFVTNQMGDSLDETQRFVYVAMTRAKKQLYLFDLADFNGSMLSGNPSMGTYLSGLEAGR